MLQRRFCLKENREGNYRLRALDDCGAKVTTEKRGLSDEINESRGEGSKFKVLSTGNNDEGGLNGNWNKLGKQQNEGAQGKRNGDGDFPFTEQKSLFKDMGISEEAEIHVSNRRLSSHLNPVLVTLLRWRSRLRRGFWTKTTMALTQRLLIILTMVIFMTSFLIPLFTHGRRRRSNNGRRLKNLTKAIHRSRKNFKASSSSRNPLGDSLTLRHT